MPVLALSDPLPGLRSAAHRLTGAPEDFDPLLAQVGDARYVLLGEASHGTHEFYRIRAAITKRLILEKGFSAVAVEADWPDAYRVNRYVTGGGDDADATEALGGFRRFPQWMWRNADVLDFVGWLRAHNDALPTAAPKVGFYGLDLYSLHASIDAVLQYLRIVDPAAARRAPSGMPASTPSARTSSPTATPPPWGSLPPASARCWPNWWRSAGRRSSTPAAIIA